MVKALAREGIFHSPQHDAAVELSADNSTNNARFIRQELGDNLERAKLSCHRTTQLVLWAQISAKRAATSDALTSIGADTWVVGHKDSAKTAVLLARKRWL
ncbi:hypothetical protein SAMN05519103_09651 [Rhizobiales bacterium GAS113]|nr:hypothetical protein SAMN05519103_09651 [Rhizobiales bacterium GAS113]